MKDKRVVLGGQCAKEDRYLSSWIKPKGKFWKRLLNKRVRFATKTEKDRKQNTYKKNSWFYWS